MKKIVMIILIVMFVAVSLQAEILVGYDFTTDRNATTNHPKLMASSFDDAPGFGTALVLSIGDNSGVDADGVAFGTTNNPGFEGTIGIGVNDTAGVNGNFAVAVTNDDYCTFTVTPISGSTFNLTSVTFKASKSKSSSVDEYAVTDGATNQIGSSAAITTIGQVTAYEGVSVDLSAPQFQNISTATEFRIYAWGDTTSTTSGTLAMLDKVVLNGDILRGTAILIQ